uniref:Lipocln_cytosolic_FA-bd_dom domain-containing protein n=1 Tax=Meloidogyne hapla TaxID=6305 RepID=A0A1I8BFZ3_MELHA
MLSILIIFIFVSSLTLNINAIGENPWDIQNFAEIISGVGQMLQNPAETVDVPSALLMGKWFQVYKASVSFDINRPQMYCAVSYFKPNSVMGEDGFSIEEAYRAVSKNGPIETFKRDLNKVGTGKYWMYTEEYFYPRQFYIIKIGPKFGNNTEVDEINIQYIVVTEKGFGGKLFWNSPKPIYQGNDCDWPSEREVFARRVLKNYENNKKEASRAATNITQTPSEAFAEIMKNPQQAIQKLMQQNFN